MENCENLGSVDFLQTVCESVIDFPLKHSFGTADTSMLLRLISTRVHTKEERGGKTRQRFNLKKYIFYTIDDNV